MTCYMRHLRPLLSEAGIDDTRANRKKAHHLLESHLGKAGEHCPIIWQEVKARLADEAAREDLIAALRQLTNA